MVTVQASCLLVVQDARVCAELYNLGVLQFLVAEMKDGFHKLPPSLPSTSPASSNSPSPSRPYGYQHSGMASLGTIKAHQGFNPKLPNSGALGSFPISPQQQCRSASSSPIKRIPTLPKAEEEGSPAEAVDRAGALHVPASAPTSSAQSTPSPSARRALSLTPSRVANQSPVVSPSKLPLASLSPQATPSNARDRSSAFKEPADQMRGRRQGTGALNDENRPAAVFGTLPAGRDELGQLPAGFKPTGDLNEDVERLIEAEEVRSSVYISCRQQDAVVAWSGSSMPTHDAFFTQESVNKCHG